MATPTYELIDSTVLSSSASSVTFSSITQDYRDLVLVANVTGSSGDDMTFNLNNTSTGYSYVFMRGNGSATASESGSSTFSEAGLTRAVAQTVLVNIMDYSATDKHKTFLIRSGAAGNEVYAFANRLPSNSAVTSVTMTFKTSGSYSAGDTFYLYGIAS